MDEATRKRYKAWRRKKIIKRFMIPGALLLALLTVAIALLTPDSTVASINKEFDEVAVTKLESIDLCERLDLTPILSALERYGDGVGIYFENLITGCTFRHNAEQDFFAASVTKAPYALWLYTKAEQGDICLDMTMYFTSADWFPGSGIIQFTYDVGHPFSLRRIIALSLYESDNTALQMLRHEFGYTGYADFIENLGGTRAFVNDIWNARITADEAGFFAREIFAYIESNQRYSNEFKQHLLNNQFPFIVSDYLIASKSGSHPDFGGAWHDMAIVYAPPYILVILSSDRLGTEDDYAVYAYISYAFQEFNRLNFVAME